MAVFDENTTGADLDIIARKPLRELGLDFNHGTGHGVGHMLSVHEGPNTISPRAAACHIVPGNDNERRSRESTSKADTA